MVKKYESIGAKYEKLNKEAKKHLLGELNKVFSEKGGDNALFERCKKEIDILYEKGLLFIIEILYNYKNYVSKTVSVSYHFSKTMNNLSLLYVLGLTNVDQIKYKLPYEIFNESNVSVYLINTTTTNLLSYIESKYFDKIKIVYGTHEKEDIEEIDKYEDNHYLLIPVLKGTDVKKYASFKNMLFSLNDSFIFETIDDYRDYVNDYFTIRIDEMLPISDYKEKGSLENALTCDFEKELAKILKPKTIQDYVKLKSIGHGTGVWKYNQDILVLEGKITLANLIATREDILEYLLEHSIDKGAALEIVNFIRKGLPKKDTGKWNDYVEIMKNHNCEDMFIDIFSKILFIFGRGQAVSECLFVLDKANYLVKKK